MPEQSLMPARPAPRAAWYGKLPGLGDFVGRRMPHAFGADWDQWLRSGLEQLRNEAPDHWADRFVHSPLWFFVSPCLVTGKPACGVVAPSIDRVGRYYPITVLAMADDADSAFASDVQLGQFFAAARAVVIDARRVPLSPEAMEARLADLVWPFASGAKRKDGREVGDLLAELQGAEPWPGQAQAVRLPNLPWRDLMGKGSEASVWWVSPAAQNFCQEVIHHGAFHRSLFSRLFRGRGAEPNTPAGAGTMDRAA